VCVIAQVLLLGDMTVAVLRFNYELNEIYGKTFYRLAPEDVRKSGRPCRQNKISSSIDLFEAKVRFRPEGATSAPNETSERCGNEQWGVTKPTRCRPCRHSIAGLRRIVVPQVIMLC
jgi:hypothetical protein